VIERISHILRKEFLELLRDRRMWGILFVIPIVQTLVFGYAVTTDVEHVRTALLDFDRSSASRDLASRLTASGYFDIVANAGDARDARRLVDHGEVQVVLRIDSGFERDLRAGRLAPVQILLDGTDSNTAGIAADYAARIVREYSREILAERAMRRRGAAPDATAVSVVSRAWFNENLESRNFYVPGVIAMLVTLITLMLTSMAIVREKEIGTIEQIMVTPIRKSEFILGKTVPFALIGFADVGLVSLVGIYWFEIPLRGSLVLLFASTALFLMSTLGIGLFISTVSSTQQQAMMSTFFYYFPAVLLSGFMFPIANMPEPVQWITYANPLRYFLIIIRGVFLKGIGADVLWPQMLALAAMGVATLWLATSRFRKTLA
jgi:ABC-2 type transport system permease protein